MNILSGAATIIAFAFAPTQAPVDTVPQRDSLQQKVVIEGSDGVDKNETTKEKAERIAREKILQRWEKFDKFFEFLRKICF